MLFAQVVYGWHLMEHNRQFATKTPSPLSTQIQRNKFEAADLTPEPTCMELLEQARAETNRTTEIRPGEDIKFCNEGEVHDNHLDIHD